MAEDAAERARRDFVGRAPELRRALVAELSGFIDRAGTLTPDEAAVLRHVLAYAGYSADGGLYVPAFAVLWGGEPSYIPPVHLPAERTRAAAVTLRRRGVLRDIRWTPAEASGHTDGVFVESGALRALAEKAEPAMKRRVILCVAASLDGYVVDRDPSVESELARDCDRVELPRGNPSKRLARLREQAGKDILCGGGGPAVHALLKKDLVDVLVVSLIPVLLGAGTPLFKKGRPERRLKLIESRSFPTGLVLLRYERA
ncbi:MAG: dihydrofolate reductase family protein [Elusimicrobia bacterium]|nr:dihydrofolate reductase family protein [Elusimicrobiota bacterium]